MAISGSGGTTSHRVSALEWVIMLVLSAVLLSLSWFKIWPLELIEVLGFSTGGICGWLIVRGDVLNWPIGLANFLFFAVLFFRAGLYADTGVQIIFFVISLYGWYEWLRGSPDGKPLPITRTPRREWVGLAIVAPLTFVLVVFVLGKIHDASPFWDGITSILSLSAQFLLSRKRLEHWYLWISAHSIYVPLYLSRGLPLTALLYAMFWAMSVYGLIQWKKEYRESRKAAA